MRHVTSCALLITAASVTHLEAQPLVTNARAETADVRGNLASALRGLVEKASGPAWVAWQVPAAAKLDQCCWNDDCRGCRLEPVPAGATVTPLASPELKLEGDTTLVVLVRIEAGQIDRLRTVGASCPLDAGGLPFTTLTGVSPAESIAWLRTLVDIAPPGRSRRFGDNAIHVIARHADPGAVPLLLELARQHSEPHVRGAALVALAQAAGRRVAPDLAKAVDTDPNTEVKKRAVFALSRLPKDDGVPLLIQLARGHENAVVRRQAMFWLGQSKDPRAIDFFASVLKE